MDSKQENILYLNRELSWMAFNKRVLNLCVEKTFPILEQMRFLSIVSTNLDEFYEIRVAGLLQKSEAPVAASDSPDGMGPRQQLAKIKVLTLAMLAEKNKIWKEHILPELKKNNVLFKEPSACSPAEKAWLKNYFTQNIYPVLTPLAIDPAHPFPHLRNKGMYVFVQLAQEGVRRAPLVPAIIPIPPILPRVIKIESHAANKDSYVFLSELVKANAGELFKGYKVKSASNFRLTRNSDLYFDEEETENLLSTIEKELHKRKQGAAVRLEVQSDIKDAPLEQLISELAVPRDFVFKIEHNPINMAHLAEAYSRIDRPDLKFAPLKPYLPDAFKKGGDIFEMIRNSDMLFHHPYDSFEPIEYFVESAAKDSDVLAIKMTLYRVNGGSPIIGSLKKAAENGKQVTVLVELKARFDEEKNIEWARQLEEAGVHVVYGIVGLKTHCKICMVVRREKRGIRRYAHLGTGNYNSITAKIYTDLSMFTCNPQICGEVADVFNTLTGKSANPKFQKLWVAPFSFMENFLQMVEREIKNAKAGKPARIIIKANAVIEKTAIDALYRASQAGVKIEMIVRGMCSLIPNVKAVSENISVKSIVGVYLEHSRIYYFENGGDYEIYAGSGDLMSRNLFRRIEVIFPVENPEIKVRIKDEILASLIKDNEFSDILHANGAYYKSPVKGALFSAQRHFSELTEKRNTEQVSRMHGENMPLKIVVHKK